MERLPNGEQELPLEHEVEEVEKSPRQELLTRADKKLAQEFGYAMKHAEEEVKQLTHFEQNGREWEIQDERDRNVAKNKLLMAQLEKLAEEHSAQGEYYEEQIARKLVEYQGTVLNLICRTAELESEYPATAAHIKNGSNHTRNE